MGFFRETIKNVREWWSNRVYRGNINNTVLDDEDGWIPLVTTAQSELQFDSMTIENIRMVSRYLYWLNPYYRGLVRTYVKYIAGRKFLITSDVDREKAAWTAWDKKYRFRRMFRKMVRVFFRDGDEFIYYPSWKMIDADLIRGEENNGAGITTDQFGNVLYYSLRSDAWSARLEPQDVQHIRDCDDNQLRGVPYLLPLMVKTDQLNKWLNDRILLNRIRSSIALLRKHTGASPTQVKNFADSKVTGTRSPKTTAYGETLRKKIFEPGSCVDASNTEYEFLSPNVDARDVSEDGRNIGLTFAAMTGLPEFIVRGDASNSNYASTMVSEGPAEKEIEDWQDFFEEEIRAIWREVMRQAGIKDPSEPLINFPPIISRNKLEETQRNEVLLANGVISVEEWRRREQVDNELMNEEINGVL